MKVFAVLICAGLASSWMVADRPALPSSRRSSPARRREPVIGFRRLYLGSGDTEGISQTKSAQIGLNELHTLLRDAVARQDYVEAGRISDVVLGRLHGEDLTDVEKRRRRRRMSWRGLGAAPWLAERLDALNYSFPTTIQINAMEAVNAILGGGSGGADDVEAMGISLEERVDRNSKDMGIVISGATGSGKTLAYLVPLLSTLSDSLFKRQRIRVGDEEMVGDTTGDLLDRVAVVTSPVVRSTGRRQILKRNGAIATGASLATLGPSGRDVTSPLALVVVPTRELGVQTALQLYRLVGGSIKEWETQFAGKSNMFKYKGPKGVRIGCVLDDEEASFGLKLQTDVAITTPQYLRKLVDDGDVKPSKLRVIVYDEADLALEQTDAVVLANLFDDPVDEREYTRLTVLVGASVTEALGNLAVSSRILPTGRSYISSATRFAPLLDSNVEIEPHVSDESRDNIDSDRLSPLATSHMSDAAPRAASLKDLDVCLYPCLKHERALVRGDAGLLVLTRLLRRELERYEQAVARGEKTGEDRPRVVVFFPDETQARAAIEPLRDALWGEHKLCVLLPKTGVRPLNIMDQFKQNETSVMLATPNSVRGLDFPAVSHVYTLYLPMDDPREYVHLAGRVGRVGQQGCVLGDGGHVISILKEEEADKMKVLAHSLGFEFTDIDTSFDLVPRLEDGSIDTESTDFEKLRRMLEDTITLVELAEVPQVNPDAARSLGEEGGSDDGDEDDYDEEPEDLAS